MISSTDGASKHTNTMKKPNKKKKEKDKEPEAISLRGEELYFAQQKKWANSFTMRRNHGEGKTKDK